MDAGYFLRDRIAFIRQFFDAASLPFAQKKRKIEAGEEPFVPPYSEDGEPPFLDEWMEAHESLQVLGYVCISMLAAALHLYLKTWEKVLRVPVGNSFEPDFKKGWLNGYKAYFVERFGVDFAKAPADVNMLEEVVLARNRIWHPDNILTTSYSAADLKKLLHPFFVNEIERGLFSDAEGKWTSPLCFPPSIRITEEKLVAAVAEVEKFSTWLERDRHVREFSLASQRALTPNQPLRPTRGSAALHRPRPGERRR